jgi:hypothetical protein
MGIASQICNFEEHNFKSSTGFDNVTWAQKAVRAHIECHSAIVRKFIYSIKIRKLRSYLWFQVALPQDITG